MLLHKVRVDAQTHEWVVRMLAEEAAEESGGTWSGNRAQTALEGAGDMAVGTGGPDASDARPGADDQTLGS